MTKASRANAEQIERALRLFHPAGDVVEVRALNVRKGNRSVKTVSGYFDDFKRAAAAGARLSGAADGVYFVLNQVNPALLARRVNRVDVAGSGETTSDRDVLRRRWLLIDCDAKRPAKISATEDEVLAAGGLAGYIAAELGDRSWPEPVRAQSGNGAHLLYRIDLPCEDGGLVQRVLEALAKRFNTETVKVDTSVHNPARITKLYGTLARKGDETGDRPWRYSSCSVPDAVVAVTEQQLLELAGSPAVAARAREGSNGVRTSFDLERWIQNWIPDARGPEPWSQGPRKWEIPSCPWNADHDQGEAFVAELASGAITAGCQHESCTWSWHELRERLEPGCYDHSARAGGNGMLVDDDRPPPSDEDAPSLPAGNGHAPTNGAAKREPLPIITVSAAIDDLFACSTLPTIATPFARLNSALGGGLIAGQSVVVPGATGSGKSSLLAAIATHVAASGPVLIGTYELPARLFIARIAAQQLDESWLNVIRGRIVRAALERVVPAGIELMYRPAMEKLERAIKTIQDRESQSPLVLLDYLQIMMSVGFSDDPRIATAKTSELVRDLADHTKAPLLLAAAVSRQNSQLLRQAKRTAQPSDLAGVARDVSNIEYDAAAVLALAVSPECDEQTGKQRAMMAVSKNRFGPTDLIGFEYYGRPGRWFESSGAMEPTEEEREETREQILASVRKAKSALSKTRIIERDGHRLVTGRRQDILPVIDELVREGQLEAIGQKFWLPGRQEKLLS